MNSTVIQHRVTLVVEKDHTVTVPAVPFEVGQRVEVIVQEHPPVGALPRFPLRGATVVYDDPFESVAQDDWDALG
jgi:hypothetical protein